MALTKEAGERMWLRRWPDWVRRASDKHAGAYTYPNPVRRQDGKIEIVCPTHGSFWQAPNKHMHGQGCPVCRGRGTDKLEDLRLKYPQWDWEGVDVSSSKGRIRLVCPSHGEFETQYNRLMNRRDGLTPCPTCNRNLGGEARRVPVSNWVERVGAMYGESIRLVSETTRTQDMATFECAEHGQFESRPNDIMSGHACPECGAHKRTQGIIAAVGVTADEFLARTHALRGGKYQYDVTTFTNMTTPMRMICQDHGEFWQRPGNHLYLSASCPRCANGVSSGEADMLEWLKSLGVNTVSRNRSVLSPQEIDIFLPDHNLGIEYCGLYWHGEEYKVSSYHQTKYLLSRDAGITLVQVFEDEWLEKRDIVESILLHKLGRSRRVYARRLSLVEVSWAQAHRFFSESHIAGPGTPAPVNLALIDEDGEIQQAVSWGLERFSSGGGYELFRMATAKGVTVVGGLSRLVAASRRRLGDKLTTFSDCRWGSGDGYKKVGFIQTHVTAPGYFWAKGSGRASRVSMQKHRLAGRLPVFDESASEADNCRANGYWKVFDAGHLKWKFNI